VGLVAAGLLTFIAVYWDKVRGQTPGEGSITQARYSGDGIAGTLAGGWLADRFGRRAVLRTSFLGMAALLGLLGAIDHPLTAALVVALLGLILALSTGVQVVLGQEYLPGRVGTASGVTIGLAVSCGGVAAPLLGGMADLHGLGVLPPVLAGLALAAGCLVCTLPRPRMRTVVADRPTEPRSSGSGPLPSVPARSRLRI
jgi:FSR family fosmidomycin resistance protein-like MFS transporter